MLQPNIQKSKHQLLATQDRHSSDSPNDESMFNQDEFLMSVGVANVIEYRDRLKYLPAYVTSKAEGEGFYELAELIIKHRK